MAKFIKNSERRNVSSIVQLHCRFSLHVQDLLAVPSVKNQKQKCNHREDQEAGFRAERTARDGVTAMKAGGKEPVSGHIAAVGPGVEVDRSEIKGGMETNGEPQVAGSAQSKAEKKSNEGNTGPVCPLLIWFGEIMQ